MRSILTAMAQGGGRVESISDILADVEHFEARFGSTAAARARLEAQELEIAALRRLTGELRRGAALPDRETSAIRTQARRMQRELENSQSANVELRGALARLQLQMRKGEDKLEAYRDHRRQLQEDCRTATARAAALRLQLDEAVGKLGRTDRLEKQVKELKKQLDAANIRKSSLRDHIAGLQKRLEKEETRSAALRARNSPNVLLNHIQNEFMCVGAMYLLRRSLTRYYEGAAPQQSEAPRAVYLAIHEGPPDASTAASSTTLTSQNFVPAASAPALRNADSAALTAPKPTTAGSAARTTPSPATNPIDLISGKPSSERTKAFPHPPDIQRREETKSAPTTTRYPGHSKAVFSTRKPPQRLSDFLGFDRIGQRNKRIRDTSGRSHVLSESTLNDYLDIEDDVDDDFWPPYLMRKRKRDRQQDQLRTSISPHEDDAKVLHQSNLQPSKRPRSSITSDKRITDSLNRRRTPDNISSSRYEMRGRLHSTSNSRAQEWLQKNLNKHAEGHKKRPVSSHQHSSLEVAKESSSLASSASLIAPGSSLQRKSGGVEGKLNQRVHQHALAHMVEDVFGEEKEPVRPKSSVKRRSEGVFEGKNRVRSKSSLELMSEVFDGEEERVRPKSSYEQLSRSQAAEAKKARARQKETAKLEYTSGSATKEQNSTWRSKTSASSVVTSESDRGDGTKKVSTESTQRPISAPLASSIAKQPGKSGETLLQRVGITPPEPSSKASLKAATETLRKSAAEYDDAAPDAPTAGLGSTDVDIESSSPSSSPVAPGSSSTDNPPASHSAPSIIVKAKESKQPSSRRTRRSAKDDMSISSTDPERSAKDVYVKQIIEWPSDRRNMISLKQSAMFLTLEGITVLEEAEPWNDMFLRRPRHSMLFNPEELSERAKRWLKATLRIQFILRREFWERLHWLPISESVCVGAEWTKYRKARTRRASYSARVWRRLYDESIELMAIGDLRDDVWCDPALWYMPVAPVSWLPKSDDLVSELNAEDYEHPSRTYFTRAPTWHPFFQHEVYTKLVDTKYLLPSFSPHQDAPEAPAVEAEQADSSVHGS